MKKYKIEHKILSLAHCAVMSDEKKPASFNAEGIEFTHWNFNYRDGWLENAWIASSYIEASDFIQAINFFRKKLTRIIPRISLISQSYIEFVLEPFLVLETSKDFAFLKYIEDKEACGLMFMEKEEKALKNLLDNKDVPEEFYFYWNDAVNSVGYSAKLLLMFSAIESIVKKHNKKDWDLVNKILGKDLVEELFGTKEEPNSGLRHRLVHGEYFSNVDNGKNYLDIIHKKVIGYFNKEIFFETLISEEVVQPQRHFFGNKEEGNLFIRNKNCTNDINLKELLEDFNQNKNVIHKLANYEYVFDKTLTANY